MLKKFFAFICCFAFSYGNVYSSSYNTIYHNSPSVDTEKVYIASNQLICTDYGIFILLEASNGNLSKVLVPQVCWDAEGLFVVRAYLPDPEAAWCRLGHKACDYCYRCDHYGCPSYGCNCKR